MGSNYKESGDTIVAEKDGNDNWVLYNQALHSASDPWLKIDDDTGEVTVYHNDLDLNGNSVNNVLGLDSKYPASAPAGLNQPGKNIFHKPLSVKNKTELFGPGNLSWTAENIYWPSVIRVDNIISSPLGKYYIYYSEDHISDSAIGLAYADNPLGPWTQYSGNPVINFTTGQDETPSVVWDPVNSRLNLYYHSTELGTNQSTGLATSTDGETWTDQGLVLDVDQFLPADNRHTGYFRPFRFGNDWIGYHLINGGNYPRFGFSWSSDGENWETDRRLIVNSIDIIGDNSKRVEWNTTNLLNYNGTLIWIGSIKDNGASGANYGNARIKIAPMTGMRSLARTPQLLVEPTAAWEGTACYTPAIFIDNSKLYIYYVSDGSIGVVQVEGEIL